MNATSTWWGDSGRFLDRHPELLSATSTVRGFDGGAKWMHRAMAAAGWRMPPVGDCGKYGLMGWMKYGICSMLAFLAAAAAWVWLGLWSVPLAVILVFYLAEAQMVFLFPEALLGRRSPCLSARALTQAAGGSIRVMVTVLPIAAGMLGAGWWRGKGREKWAQGCMAVILWHRHVALGRRGFSDDYKASPKLEIGSASPLFLRRESVQLAGTGRFRLLWISDLHWRGMSDAGTLMSLLGMVRKEKPDICILGGDFLESLGGIPLLRTLIRAIVRASPCVALPGNHDRGPMLETIASMVRDAGACWLPDVQRFEVSDGNGGILEITGHTSPVKPGSAKRVFAVHDPAELDGGAPVEGTLVLAGHIHGGQCVLASKNGRLLPAAWIYSHAWLRRKHAGAEWIVCRGAGDTLPIRWNCPREAILCEIS